MSLELFCDIGVYAIASPGKEECTMPRRVHDRGGWPKAGPIDRAEHDLSMWEQRTDALLRLLTRKHLMRVDELRRAIEDLEPSEYEQLGYYERWIEAIRNIMTEKGILARAEIEQKVAMHEHNHDHAHDAHIPIEDKREMTYHEKLTDAIMSLLVEKGVVTADEVRQAVEAMDAITHRPWAPRWLRKRGLIRNLRPVCSLMPWPQSLNSV